MLGHVRPPFYAGLYAFVVETAEMATLEQAPRGSGHQSKHRILVIPIESEDLQILSD